MKERLDDLLNDADKTLLELDATGRAGNSSTTEENEVDRDTAMRFNHTPTEMKSAFWRRYQVTGSGCLIFDQEQESECTSPQEAKLVR
jgi:hypothetical protein